MVPWVIESRHGRRSAKPVDHPRDLR